MDDFKWRHFQGEIILRSVRWYCKYPLAYRHVEDMLKDRGLMGFVAMPDHRVLLQILNKYRFPQLSF